MKILGLSNKSFFIVIFGLVILGILIGNNKISKEEAEIQKKAYVASYFIKGENEKASEAVEVFVIIPKQNKGGCVHVIHTPNGYFIMPGKTLNDATFNGGGLDFKGPYSELTIAIENALNSYAYYQNAYLYYEVINGDIYDKTTGKNWGHYFK